MAGSAEDDVKKDKKNMGGAAGIACKRAPTTTSRAAVCCHACAAQSTQLTRNSRSIFPSLLFYSHSVPTAIQLVVRGIRRSLVCPALNPSLVCASVRAC
eukprot:1650353-Pleurochrysis_carterae.AAC.1